MKGEAGNEMTAFPGSRKILVACAIALLCSGCFKREKLELTTVGSSGGTPPAANSAPTISGTPSTSLVVGQAYDFQPAASDPDGDALTFSIQNRPVWATFNASTGRLNGTPGAGDVGQFSDVRIAVSDGQAQASLNSFSIAVNQIAMGSVTLSWAPPTTNADGSTITDLSGYRIYYGRSADTLEEMVIISNAGTARWIVDNLSAATWYFSMTSYNSSGIESARSTVVSLTLT
jgi:hypothetical protein